MKEKEPIKISFKVTVLLILLILVIIFGILFFMYYLIMTPSSSITSSTGLTSKTTIYSDTKKDIPTTSNTKYNTYSVYVHSNYSPKTQLDNIFVTSNDELKLFLSKCINTDSVYIESQNGKKTITEYFNNDFFQNYNLAIEMYDASSSHHSYSIVSVIANGSNGTINIKDDFHTYGGSLSVCATLVFIALDKEIEHVDFDIYRTTTNNSYNTDYPMMFIAGIIIFIAVIFIVSLIVSKHNDKIHTISSLDNNSERYSTIRNFKFNIIIIVLILTVLFSAFVFYVSIIKPNTFIY